MTRKIFLLFSLAGICCRAQGIHPEWRGLLAGGQPVKGVYFFAGEGDDTRPVYTSHPTLPDDLHWNSDPASRARVMARLAAAHVNTVVMSYWSDMPQWSPMALTVQNGLSVPGVVEAVNNLPLVVMCARDPGCFQRLRRASGVPGFTGQLLGR